MSIASVRLNELLDDCSGPYVIDGEKSFLGVETFQMGPTFNFDFSSSEPVLVFLFDWGSKGTMLGAVSCPTTNRKNMNVYLSQYGRCKNEGLKSSYAPFRFQFNHWI